MKEKKLCLVCGCEFEPKNKKGVYCSSVCRQKDYRRRLVPIVEMGRRVNPATPEQLVALHNAENKDQTIELTIIPKKVEDAPIKPPESNETIKKQIDEIKKEKIPKERDTPNGRKYWAFDQKKRIEELEKKLTK